MRNITQAMESITTKINAIFDNDNDAWQEMTLEVCACLSLRLSSFCDCRPSAGCYLSLLPAPRSNLPCLERDAYYVAWFPTSSTYGLPHKSLRKQGSAVPLRLKRPSARSNPHDLGACKPAMQFVWEEENAGRHARTRLHQTRTSTSHYSVHPPRPPRVHPRHL